MRFFFDLLLLALTVFDVFLFVFIFQIMDILSLFGF